MNNLIWNFLLLLCWLFSPCPFAIKLGHLTMAASIGWTRHSSLLLDSEYPSSEDALQLLKDTSSSSLSFDKRRWRRWRGDANSLLERKLLFSRTLIMGGLGLTSCEITPPLFFIIIIFFLCLLALSSVGYLILSYIQYQIHIVLFEIVFSYVFRLTTVLGDDCNPSL